MSKYLSDRCAFDNFLLCNIIIPVIIISLFCLAVLCHSLVYSIIFEYTLRDVLCMHLCSFRRYLEGKKRSR